MKTKIRQQIKPRFDPPSIDGIRYMVILEMISHQDYSAQNLLQEIKVRSNELITVSWGDIWGALLHLSTYGMAESYDASDSCCTLYTITADGREYLGRLKQQYIDMVDGIAGVLGTNGR